MQLKPMPEVTVPSFSTERVAPTTRMEKLTSRLYKLSVTNTILGVVAVIIGFLCSSQTPAIFLTTLCLVLLSTIPLWIVYGFAWALADFQVKQF